MQPWTKWFREQQEAVGTVEDFAHASGIKIRMVSAYRAGVIPRRREQLDKIRAIFGSTGPLPGSEHAQTIEDRFGALEAKIVELELRLAAIEPATSPVVDDGHLADRQRRTAKVVAEAVRKAKDPPLVEAPQDTAQPAPARPRARRSTG